MIETIRRLKDRGGYQAVPTDRLIVRPDPGNPENYRISPFLRAAAEIIQAAAEDLPELPGLYQQIKLEGAAGIATWLKAHGQSIFGPDPKPNRHCVDRLAGALQAMVFTKAHPQAIRHDAAFAMFAVRKSDKEASKFMQRIRDNFPLRSCKAGNVWYYHAGDMGIIVAAFKKRGWSDPTPEQIEAMALAIRQAKGHAGGASRSISLD